MGCHGCKKDNCPEEFETPIYSDAEVQERIKIEIENSEIGHLIKK